MTTGKCYVARSTDVAARLIGGEMMIMSGRDASLFCLNETASLLWKAADGEADIDQIAALVCAQYDVAPGTAREDLLQVARELAAHRLMVLSETPAGRALP